MLQTIALVNVDKDPRIKPSDLISIGAALTKQFTKDLAPIFGDNFYITGIGEKIPPSAWICHILKNLDDPEAMAYHMRDKKGMPALFSGIDVCLNNGGTVLSGPNSISVGIGHECIEAAHDPYCTWWSDYDRDEEVALEDVDPVQSTAYAIDGVAVPNFIYPEWYNSQAPHGAQLDQMGVLKKPLTIGKGGYMVLRKGGPNGTQREVFGEDMPEYMRKFKSKMNRRKRLITKEKTPTHLL